MTTRVRRATQWYETIQQDIALLPSAQDFLDLLSNIASGNRQGATVTRMILDIRIRAAALTAVHEMYWGIAVFNADAVAAGAFPESDLVDDTNWLVHGRLLCASSNLSDHTQGDRVLMDIRSQRVLRAQQDRLIMVRDNATATTITFNCFARVLVKHP